MGNDGGSLAKRSEILRRFKRELEPVSSNRASLHDLYHCSMTGKEFKEGDVIVGDSLGNLYLKIEVLNHLIERKKQKNDVNVAFGHIKSFNDIVEIKGTPNNDTEGYLVPCGCLFESISGLDLESRECPNCKVTVDLTENIVLFKVNSKRNLERMRGLKAGKRHHNNKPVKRKDNSKGIEKKYK